jgi:hypothetical protein
MEAAMMRRFVSLCCAAGFVALGCAKSDDQAVTDTAGGTVAASPASGTISLADVAGRWNVRAVPESGSDTTAVNSVLTATGDTTGWTLTLPGRAPVAVRVVMVAGDSVVTEAGPYESVRRRGVQVTTRNVARLRDGKLVGTTVARYRTTGPDSVLRLRTEGTRAP